MARPLAPRGQGRARVIDAALEQFAVHGVHGTSLQMIADHLGVTKAAVYYQFHAKEDIVLAVVETAFDELAEVVAAGEAAGLDAEAGDLAITGLVDLMIHHRRAVATLFGDPEARRMVESHRRFQDLKLRLGALLTGPDPDVRRQVGVAVVGAGMAQAVMDPELARLTDDELRDGLLHVGRTLLTTVVRG